MRIATREIGKDKPCFVIAEAGVNHNGRMDLARALVDAAAEAGADAIKFQTFRASGVASARAQKAAYQLDTTSASESQIDMLRRLELSVEDFVELKEYCETHDILFLSTPHDDESVHILGELGVAAFKIGSGDLTNLPFLVAAAKYGVPILLSTGLSTLDEVRIAVEALVESDNPELVLLHCVSDYPAAVEESNLRAMKSMADAFGFPVGFSDHSLGDEAAIAAVAMGACVIEKHFTVDRRLEGPDHAASLEPEALGSLITKIRNVEAAFGDGVKKPTARELLNRDAVRKSLVAACDIRAGSTIEQQMVVAKRPGTGMQPGELARVVGRTARVHIAQDAPLRWEDLNGG